MPVNASPEYINAEREYDQAENIEEKIECLKRMISYAPAHKGGENLRAQLKTRLKKFIEKKVKDAKSKGSKKEGIKKGDLQTVIIGHTNVGRSSLLNALTNAEPEISARICTTTQPMIGIMKYETVDIQIIENPPIESAYYDKGLTNSADVLIIIVKQLKEIEEIEQELTRATKKRIIVVSKTDLLSNQEKRKIEATLKTKKYNAILLSTKTKEGLERLKNKIFQEFDKIRIYTKEPGKEKTKRPMILEHNATVKDVAEKILKGFSKNIKTTKIWGPSSKFPGQIVGLNHKVKDLDIIEFKTK